MLKLNAKVRRNPRVWKNDTTVFTIVSIRGNEFLCQRAGKTECPWTGKQVPHDPRPYLASELVAA